MCTSLIYRDLSDKVYHGRTLELAVALPYRMAYVPKGYAASSAVAGHPALAWTTRHAAVAVAMPDRAPSPGRPAAFADLKVIEGLNEMGLTFSLLSYPDAGGPQPDLDPSRPALPASDLGLWALGQFGAVAEVRRALETQQVALQALSILGGLVSPFHYIVYDAGGDSLVIEFDHGKRAIYHNPVGVMTNAPRFDWHLTNLNNYTFMDNVDRSRARFGRYEARQPGSGIAKVGLPGSDTSVDRFIRAIFYAQFAEREDTPDKAIAMLAHVMNNFDRPRGITIDEPNVGSGHLSVQGAEAKPLGGALTEFTSWTSLSDLDRKLMFVRPCDSLNFVRFDLTALADASAPLVLPLDEIDSSAADGAAALMRRAA